MRQRDERSWKIDRRIPVAVILTFVIQMAGALIWATELDARVSAMEHQTVSASGVNEKFARLEERLENMKQDLGFIRRQLEHMTDRMMKK